MQTKIQAKLSELAEAIREDVVAQLLATVQGAGKSARRAPAPPTEAERGRAWRKKGEKRSPGVITQTANLLHRAISTAPGSGIEYLAKQMGKPTSDLVLPVKKLLAKKLIMRKGHKRATKYFPRAS